MSNRFLRIAAYLLVVLAAAVGVYKASDRSIDRERTAQIAACERVQILRDQANGTNLLVYDTFQGVLKQQKELRKKAKTSQEKHQATITIARAQAVVNTTVVTGPTNCQASVDRPDTYRPPAPQFIVEDGHRNEVVRERAQDIVRYAKRHEPLPPVLDKRGRPIDRLP